MKPTTRLRQLLGKPAFLTTAGVWDAAGAKLVEQAGFPIVYAGGHAISASYGYPDVGLVTMTEMVDRIRTITAAVKAPVICDADTGYGNILNARRAIREFERAGVAGCHIEDQTFPKRCGSYAGKSVISRKAMADKIKAAADARSDPDFVIIARTDAIDIEGLDATIERAQAYAAAGADMIMPDNGKTFGLPQMKRFVSQMSVPAIMLALETDTWVRGHRMWGVSEAKKCGYKMAIFPLSLLYGSLKNMKDVLGVIQRTGTADGMLTDMSTSAELGALLGLAQIHTLEARYQ